MRKSVSMFVGMMVVFLSLTGCFSVDSAQLHTQAQGEVALKADQYTIELGFSEQAATSEGALAKLNTSLLDFITWKDASGFDVVTQNQSVQPVYYYPKDGLRELRAYQAQHRFKIKALSLQQYTDAMGQLSALKPESLYQGEVGVSDSIRKQAMQQAYALACAANQEKLKTLLDLSELCWPAVQEIKEYTNARGAPRAMMMEAKAAPVANEQVISVRLEVSWKASAC